MRLLRILAAASALAASTAFSQTANVNDGKWEVTIPYPSKPVVADLDLAGEGGMFRSHAGGKTNTCGGRETPVSVVLSTADELKFTIHYSKVLEGCKDMTFDVKRADDSSFKGTWPDKRFGPLEAVVKRKH